MVGVINNWIAGNAPVLVPDDPLAVFAGRRCIVAIAVVLKRWDALRHRSMVLFKESALSRDELLLDFILRPSRIHKNGGHHVNM